MKPWMKVALGCLAVSVVAVFLLVAGRVGFGFWAKNKVEEVTGGGPAVEAARKAANAVPFTRPDRSIVAEPRLVKFIEIRAGVFSVYEKYRGEIESRVARVKDGKSLDFGDISTGLTLMGELQKTETLALAKHGMSEDEYAFISGEVYKSMWTDFGGGEASKKAIKGAAEAAKASTEAMKAAGPENMSAEARDALAKAGSEITAGAQQAAREIEKAGTAPENVALFKKYEADLKKYAMPGLHILFDHPGGDSVTDQGVGSRPSSSTAITRRDDAPPKKGSGNNAHDLLAAQSERQRNQVLTHFMMQSNEKCEAVERNFFRDSTRTETPSGT